jgi:hypothetical protein
VVEHDQPISRQCWVQHCFKATRNDFASWRDWRVSEAEKKHLNGHVPFPNDMVVFQQLGASGYNDEEAKKIMNILANVNRIC